MRALPVLLLLLGCPPEAPDTADTDTGEDDASCEADTWVYALFTADTPGAPDRLTAWWADPSTDGLQPIGSHLATSGSSQERTALAIVGDHLVVGHAGDAALDVYALDACGRPTAVAGSPFTGAGPTRWLAASPDGDRVFAASDGLIHGYDLGADGALTRLDTQTAAVEGAGLAVTSDGGRLLWATSGAMRSVTVGPSGFGTLETFLMVSIADPAAVRVREGGGYAWVRETSSGWHRVRIDGTTLLYDGATPGGEGLALASGDDRVWTLDTSGQVRAWGVGETGGDVPTEATGSPWTTRPDAQYLAMDLVGGWVLTSHPDDDRIQVFRVDGTGGLQTGILHTHTFDEAATSAGPIAVRRRLTE